MNTAVRASLLYNYKTVWKRYFDRFDDKSSSDMATGGLTALTASGDLHAYQAFSLGEGYRRVA